MPPPPPNLKTWGGKSPPLPPPPLPTPMLSSPPLPPPPLPTPMLSSPPYPPPRFLRLCYRPPPLPPPPPLPTPMLSSPPLPPPPRFLRLCYIARGSPYILYTSSCAGTSPYTTAVLPQESDQFTFRVRAERAGPCDGPTRSTLRVDYEF